MLLEVLLMYHFATAAPLGLLMYLNGTRWFLEPPIIQVIITDLWPELKVSTTYNMHKNANIYHP